MLRKKKNSWLPTSDKSKLGNWVWAVCKLFPFSTPSYQVQTSIRGQMIINQSESPGGRKVQASVSHLKHHAGQWIQWLCRGSDVSDSTVSLPYVPRLQLLLVSTQQLLVAAGVCAPSPAPHVSPLPRFWFSDIQSSMQVTCYQPYITHTTPTMAPQYHRTCYISIIVSTTTLELKESKSQFCQRETKL